MRPPSTKYKVGQLRVRLNEFVKPQALDQKDFADLVGTTKHAVVSLEVGRLKLSRPLAWRIAQATGVGFHWLLDDDDETPIVNNARRPYTKSDFNHATKRSGQKEFTRTVTGEYADRFNAKVRAILASAIKNDKAEEATRKIERFLDHCLHEFDSKFDANLFELREMRWREQKAMTPAQRRDRVRKPLPNFLPVNSP